MPVTVAIKTPPRYTLYAVTPTLSVDALHAKLICVLETEFAVKPSGTDGGLVSTVLLTDTVADLLTEPPAPVQVTAYVVVRLGVTTTEPLVWFVVNPEPVQLVALVDDQDSVVVFPTAIVAGFAESVTVGAAATLTNTVTESCVLPPAPIHVIE